MTPTDIPNGGWLALLAFAIAFVVRLLRADLLNGYLVAHGLPAIPKGAMPWIAAALGVAATAITAVTNGATWDTALLSSLWGLLAAASATWVHEAAEKPVRATLGNGVGDIVFGRKGGNPNLNGAAPPAPPPRAPTIPTGTACLFMAALALGSSGCATMSKLLPYLADAAIVVQDAANVLNQADDGARTWFASHPNPAAEAKFDKALTSARTSLDGALRLIHGAQALDDAQYTAAFDEFRKAYADVLAVLHEVGALSDGHKLAARAGAPPILLPAPLALSPLRVRR